MRINMLTAIAACIMATAASAQSPPPVPHRDQYCGLPGYLQQRVNDLAMQFYAQRDMDRMVALNGLLKGWGEGCEQRYQAAMQEWRAEMLRWQLTR